MTLNFDRLAAIAGIFGCWLAPATVQAASDGWMTDLAAAKKLASETKRDLFMDFTGSDW